MNGKDDLRNWQLLCDQMPNEETLTAMQKMRGFYRTKTIRSGDLLEIEVYPILPRKTVRDALEKKGVTKESQRRLNQKNAEKRLVRLVETNFTDKDYFFTATIEDEMLPTLDQVQKLVQNFLKRVNYRRKQKGLQNARYIYVIEGYEEGSRQQRLHLHVIIDGALDRAELKEIWGHGRCKCDELDTKSYNGLINLAKYIAKDPRGRKRWRPSKGLKQPTITTADRKVSARAAGRIAESTSARAAALEKLYPGYEHIETEVKTNSFISGAYIYAIMRRKPQDDIKKHKGGKRHEQSDSDRPGRDGSGIRSDDRRGGPDDVQAGSAEKVQKQRRKVRR